MRIQWAAGTAAVVLMSGGAVGGADEAAPAPARVDNPYAGARVYVDEDWSARAAAEPGGAAVAREPTAVWLDRIAALDGLRGHLDAALAQDADVIQLVVHNAPGRDCHRHQPRGELVAGELDRYRTEFIDPLAGVLADPAYADLRVVTVLEPGALACERAQAPGVHAGAVGTALARLGPLPNVYPYLDLGDHALLGRDASLAPAAALLHAAASTAGADPADVHGFVSNVGGYAPLDEPHFDADDTVGGVPVREGSSWLDGNHYADELSYVRAFQRALTDAGFDPAAGALLDTSRNGWGGPGRPAGPGPRTAPEEYVEAGRTDRRHHPANWCNQAGSGLGERPVAAPVPGVDAYIWARPPGLSDGNSIPIPIEGGDLDRMCDPAYAGDPVNGGHPTGVLSGAPLRGQWFPAHFGELLRNAWPPLPPAGG
ncbi:glycoside hydrolase family 6 protein [Streptomyces sp. SBT349]|uniref:glycoside hydrolase family 6 protein n=1 Tax=Streptomyces sp. SBT349 TaxID=1580539 RepID=UPI00069F02B3|nr:glycoside hydrolase family 6 protein [Streptomyces sp. SBT349]